MSHRLTWLVAIAWGLFIAAVGMQAIDPTPLSPAEIGFDGPPIPAIYLLAAGMVTCVVGLVGLLGWKSQPSGAAATSL